MFSDELIVGIATCVTTIIATAFTIRTNKLHPIDEERYKKVLFPIMCILQAEDFRFNSIEKSTAAILKINPISILSSPFICYKNKMARNAPAAIPVVLYNRHFSVLPFFNSPILSSIHSMA